MRALDTHRSLVRALSGRTPALAASDGTDAGTNTLRLLDPRIAWAYCAVAVVVALVFALGVLDQAVYPLMLGGTCASIVIGVRRNRPTVLWHWWLFIVADLLWATAGIVRQSVHATGVLTSSRSLLPDVFAIPAYVVVAAALTGLMRARRTGRGDRDAWLDGLVVSLAALLIAWVFALRPAVADPSAWLPAQLAVAIYPPLSALLVTIACSLAFGVRRRSASHQLVFAGTAFLLAGDIAFAMEEVGTLKVGRVFELPFLIASALFGAAALHPSMRHLTSPISRRRGRLTTARVAMIAVALLLPAVVAVAAPASSTAAKWFLGIILCMLALAAALRLLFTVREQALSEARLAHQATHDDLTGLPNRTLALERIEERLRANENNGARVAVMFADLDQFKLINDSMGHAVGDELLIAAARRLRGAVSADDVVARISGDEFLIVCNEVDTASAVAIAERMRNAISAPFELSTNSIYVTTSIGIALSDGSNAEDGPSLVRDADTAMYRSKTAGRNTITCFGVQMRQQVERRVELERNMRIALERQEIVPYFQPLVSLPAGQIEGFEALARWTTPAGPVRPDEFIPVAEESGLIVPLGAAMLEQACAQLAEWRRTLPGAANAYVSVNLSVQQVLESDIVDTVADVLERWDLPGEALWLEITESVLMEDTVETQAVLNALRELGVSLSVDDFGTGFSSLSYLRRYPVGKVKIDKSFVDALDGPDADASLVEAIIAMAAALDLTTIAEGVERHAQAARLFELGCNAAQGYHFARPMPPADIPFAVLPLGFAKPHGRTPWIEPLD